MVDGGAIVKSMQRASKLFILGVFGAFVYNNLLSLGNSDLIRGFRAAQGSAAVFDGAKPWKMKEGKKSYFLLSAF